jgi:hypothetical protein
MSALFNLNKSLAPCLVRALYCVALVVIALGLLRAVVVGVEVMNRPPPAQMAGAPGTPPQPMAGQPMPGGPAAGAEQGRPDFGPRGPRFMRPRLRPIIPGAPWLRSWPPVALGALRIVLALLRAAVMVMVVRILAEMALGILAMGAKARA